MTGTEKKENNEAEKHTVEQVEQDSKEETFVPVTESPNPEDDIELVHDSNNKQALKEESDHEIAVEDETKAEEPEMSETESNPVEKEETETMLADAEIVTLNAEDEVLNVQTEQDHNEVPETLFDSGDASPELLVPEKNDTDSNTGEGEQTDVEIIPERSSDELSVTEMVESEESPSEHTHATAELTSPPVVPDTNDEQGPADEVSKNPDDTEDAEDVLHKSHDEEEDEELAVYEAAENYTGNSIEELVEMLAEVSSAGDPMHVRKKFSAIRKAIIDKLRKERDDALANYLSQGGNKDDFEAHRNPAEDRFNHLVTDFRGQLNAWHQRREEERKENLRIKEEVIEELKNVIQNEEDILKAFDTVHALQAKWRATGIIPSDRAEDLWQKYRYYVGKFYDLIRIHKELQELDHKKNLEARLSLCDQVEDLLLEPSINKAMTGLRHLQSRWRDIGPVSREHNQETWDRFKAVADNIYARRREHIESLKSEFEANMVVRIALCEKAEALVDDEPDKWHVWQKKTDEMLALQGEWKKAGPPPRSMNEKLWHRFRLASDRFFSAKKDFFSSQKSEQNHNKQLKTDLCVQAESLVESTEWKESAETLKKLQLEWRNIGPVHQKVNNQLWTRFRQACDTFFENRNKHFKHQDGEFGDNLKKKEDLIGRIASFEMPADKKAGLDSLKLFQQEWSEIGMVPIKVKDVIYRKYRSAIDDAHRKLGISSEEVRDMAFTDRMTKAAADPGTGISTKERGALRFRIDKLTEEVRLLENNIGFFANTKGAESLKKDVERKIENAKSELQKLKTIMKAGNSQS